MQRWLPFLEHHQLVVFTDNTTVFHGLRRRSVRGPAADPLRKITLKQRYIISTPTRDGFPHTKTLSLTYCPVTIFASTLTSSPS